MAEDNFRWSVLLFVMLALAAPTYAGTVGPVRSDSHMPLLNVPNSYEVPRSQNPNTMMLSAISDKADVIMLGDSITEFGAWSELFPEASIVNWGIAGDTSEGVLRRVSDVIARKPKIVFLMIGINDLLRGIQPETVQQNVRAIVSALAEYKIRTVLQSTLPVTDNADINSKVGTLNALLRSLDGATFIDLTRELAPRGVLLPTYTSDGLHLNNAAYLIWKDAIAPVMSPL